MATTSTPIPCFQYFASAKGSIGLLCSAVSGPDVCARELWRRVLLAVACCGISLAQRGVFQ